MKILRMTTDGHLTFCASPNHKIGSGRCNHCKNEHFPGVIMTKTGNMITIEIPDVDEKIAEKTIKDFFKNKKLKVKEKNKILEEVRGIV